MDTTRVRTTGYPVYYLGRHRTRYAARYQPVLEKLAEMHGYEFVAYAVDHPGQEQSATWLSRPTIGGFCRPTMLPRSTGA